MNIKEFPTTRYQGSKRKILDWLYENLREIEFNTVLDGFGGTGLCSYLFKKMDKSVTYNDYLRFNSIIGRAIIENQTVNLTDEEVNFVLYNRQNENRFIELNFDNIYYTQIENQWLDSIIQNIEHIDGPANEIEYKKSLCYYALFQACLRKRPFNLFHRKNLYIRTNDVERNFGNKTTWEKGFESEFRHFVAEANRIVFNSNTNCNVLNQSIFDIENEDVYDLVYLDPPYVSGTSTNETSDYLRCYHFLEGISNYERWHELIDYNSINLRFKSDVAPNQFNKENIHNSLDLLFSKFQNSIIVLSYKIGGIPSIEEIETLMRNYKDDVVTISKHYKYALNKQNGNAAYNREVIIIGR